MNREEKVKWVAEYLFESTTREYTFEDEARVIVSKLEEKVSEESTEEGARRLFGAYTMLSFDAYAEQWRLLNEMDRERWRAVWRAK